MDIKDHEAYTIVIGLGCYLETLLIGIMTILYIIIMKFNNVSNSDKSVVRILILFEIILFILFVCSSMYFIKEIKCVKDIIEKRNKQ